MGIFDDSIGQQKTPYQVLSTMKRVKPGHTAFEYNSIDTFVINRIVERITGRPLAQEFSDRIWTKIGAEHDGYVVVSDQGYSMHFGLAGFRPLWRDLHAQLVEDQQDEDRRQPGHLLRREFGDDGGDIL